MKNRNAADSIFEAITAFLIAGMVALTLLQVVTRYGMHAGFEWTEELARLDLIYLTFFGSIVALRRGQHLRIETLVDALPAKLRRATGIVVNVLSIAVLMVVVWQGIPLLPQFWPVLSAALGWPTTVFYLPVIVGCLVMAIIMLVDLVRSRGADEIRAPPPGRCCMSLFLLFAVMLVCTALGMNIGLAMIASSILYLVAHSGSLTSLPLAIVPMKMLYGVDSFPLLAVPLFMLAGELMSAGGIMTRIVRFATALVGSITGGLAHVNIVVNMIMAGMSGSAVADVAATGSILIPAMVRVGFTGAFAAAVTAAAATIGPIIPPSIPFVLIGSIAQVSIGRLFLGGAIPGILMGFLLMAAAYWVAKRHGYAVERRATLRELGQSFWAAIPALLMPAIVMGGIFTGVTTPTEAAVVAVVYALFLSVGVYRQLSLRDCYRVCVQMGSSTAAIMLTIAGATLLGFIATAEQMGPKLMHVFLSFSSDPLIILLIVNVALLALGCVMEPVPIILLTVPIFFPALAKLGIDPVQLGVVMTLNLMIGLLTPFVGLNLFIASAIARVPLLAVARESVIFIATLIVVLLLITLFPQLVLWLPNYVMGS